MQFPINIRFRIQSRINGALSLALAVALFAGTLAPVAHADVTRSSESQPTATTTAETVLVPRLTKGAIGPLVRVQADSAIARRYFAARTKAGQANHFCPGTNCPKTIACHDTKGALGAGCTHS